MNGKLDTGEKKKTTKNVTIGEAGKTQPDQGFRGEQEPEHVKKQDKKWTQTAETKKSQNLGQRLKCYPNHKDGQSNSGGEGEP